MSAPIDLYLRHPDTGIVCAFCSSRSHEPADCPHIPTDLRSRSISFERYCRHCGRAVSTVSGVCVRCGHPT